MVKTKFLPKVREALRLRLAAAVRRACLCLVRTAKAKRLLELLSRPVERAQACLAGQATRAAGLRPRPGSHQQQVTRRHLAARPHALAAEYSLDFRF